MGRVGVEGAIGRADQRVVPLLLGDLLGDELQIAEIVGQLVLGGDVVDQILHLEHVAGAQAFEAHDLGAVVVVKAVPRLGEILVVALAGIEDLDLSVGAAAEDARLADLDLLDARRVAHIELLVVFGAAIGLDLDDPLRERLGQTVAVDAHDPPIQPNDRRIRGRGRR